MKTPHTNDSANPLRKQAKSAKGKERETYGVPSEALEILRRWRESNARKMPKWEVTAIFTKGEARG